MAKAKGPIAKKLISLRKRYKISQAIAAQRTGVALRTWIAWENDQRKPGQIAKRLLKAAFPDYE